MSRRRPRQVEIFNFSFLDILACTIGLLIFIMVMVFILQSGSPVADAGAIIQQKLGQAASLRSTATHDAEIAQVLEAMFDQVQAPQEPDLTPQRTAARAARDAARDRYDGLARQVAAAQSQLDETRLARNQTAARTLGQARAELAVAQGKNERARTELAAALAAADTNRVEFLPVKKPGDEPPQVLHVDCRAGSVVLYRVGPDGKLVEAGRTNVGELGDAGSDYQRLIASHRALPHALMLFWVRPDGADTLEAAKQQLPPATPYGYEPADASWLFGEKVP